MIKNIPNKLTRADLVRFIEEVVKQRMDFLYLRIDFKNGELFCYSVLWRCGCSLLLLQGAMLDMRS